MEHGDFNVSNSDMDGRLDPGEQWLFTAMVTADETGQFTNIVKVTGTSVDSLLIPPEKDRGTAR